MVSAGDAILQATDRFVKAKIDSLELSAASKQATQAQDLAIEANQKLTTDFNNTPDGEFNAQSQVDWYDQRINELSGVIKNKDQRTKYQNLLKKNRGSFAISASELEFKDQINLEQSSSKARVDNFGKVMADNQVDPEDILLTTLEVNKYARESATKTGTAIYDTEDEAFVVMALTEKSNRIKEDFALRKISRADYESQLESLGSRLTQSGGLDHLGAGKRISLAGVIRELKVSSQLAGNDNYLNQLKSDYPGTVNKIEAGFEIDQKTLDDYSTAAAQHPENLGLQTMNNRIQILAGQGNLFTSIRVGDAKKAKKDLDQMKIKLPSLNGAKYDDANLAITVLEKKVQESNVLRIENTAEAFKNNPDVKNAWATALVDPTPDNRATYVTNLIRLDKEQGGSGNNIEFFNKQTLANYVSSLDGMTPDQMEAQILSLKDEWSQSVDTTGSTVAESIINQIAATGSPINIAARYAGTTSYNSIHKAQSAKKETLAAVAGDKATMKLLEEAVIEQSSDYFQALIDRNPDKPETAARELMAILKTAQYAPLDNDSDVKVGFGNDVNKAAKWAFKMHVSNHQEVKRGGRVSLLIPIDPLENREAKQILKLGPSELGDLMFKETAKRAGLPVQLRGDDSALINALGVPGLELETLDYKSLKDGFNIIQGQDGKKWALSIPVQNGRIPASLGSKDGTRIEVEFSISELSELIAQRNRSKKKELGGSPFRAQGFIDSLRGKAAKPDELNLDTTLSETAKQRAASENVLNEQRSKIEATDEKIKEILKGLGN
jgi:hypothetical protein